MVNVDFKKRDVMISWSGGLDSTLILLKAVEKINKGEIDSIILTYFDIEILNKNKKEKEKYTRMRVLKKLKETGLIDDDIDSKIYGTSIFVEHLSEREGDLDNYLKYSAERIAPQPFLWITNTLAYVDDRYELIYGHLGDDSYSKEPDYIPNLYKMVESTNKVMKKDFIIGLPLINYTKDEIIKEYFENDAYLKILPLLSFCESPDDGNNSCGICECCEKMIKTLIVNNYGDKFIEILDGQEDVFSSILKMYIKKYEEVKNKNE